MTRQSTTPKPRVIPAPSSLRALGPLVVVDGDCPYFKDDRKNRTAFALPGSPLDGPDYDRAMQLGMRRSGALVYRPVCPTCRRCQPFRIDVEKFQISQSQKRVKKRCDGRFTIDIARPTADAERLNLYARYQAGQHGADGQTADQESYERFLCESVAETWELAWRDKEKKLVGVGIIDVVPSGVSTVYFYWDPSLRDLSIGVYSALHEIALCQAWKKRYYYLGYLVAGSKTMSYKASFSGGEIWNGETWDPMPTRDLDDEKTAALVDACEASSISADARQFKVD